MAVDDIAVLRLVGRYQDQNIVNTMHYLVTEQTTSDLQLWLDLINGWYTAHNVLWLGEFIDEFIWVGLKAFTARGDTKPPGERTIGNAGTVAENPAPAFVCRTITLYSSSPNPRVRGRIMLSGSSEIMFDDADGAVVAGQLITMQALGDDLIEEVVENDNHYQPCLYNKATDTVSLLVAAKARTTPSVVRSRRIKRMLIG